MTRILGISAYYHDSAAVLIEDGRIVAAAQEERFTRKKGDASLPHNAIAFCLEAAGATEHTVDHIVFYEDPKAKFDRLLTNYHLTAPFSLRSFLTAMPAWLTNKLWMERGIARELGTKKSVHLCDHHLSHAASAFFPAPFESAAVLTIDGVGEWSTATIAHGEGNRLRFIRHMRYPNSVGLLYSAVTYYIGFKVSSGEYKVMGLAPYGKPRFADLMRERLVRVSDDGSIVLNQRYFGYTTGLRMINRRFETLFGQPRRRPESELTQFQMDIAASVQAVVNEVVLKMAAHARQVTGCRNLCLAGGVALNCVANGLLSHSGLFDRLWIQPAAGDAGGALGAALWWWHQVLEGNRTPMEPDSMNGAFLGPDIAAHSTADDAMLERLGAVWKAHEDNSLPRAVAALINSGKIVGVARGRMEFGPRALGARSILADARSETMQSRMNLKIKFRESFRPFAPIVLAEDASNYFDMAQASPYMLLVYPVLESRRRPVDAEAAGGLARLKVPHSDIPAVTHVDYSARVQTVDEQNVFAHAVLTALKDLSGCSVAINTSFNVRGEPIVCTAEDAYRCFMATEMDAVVIGNRLMLKDEQASRPITAEERQRWLQRFDLD
jgi:carbamoyltransferase